MFKLDWQGSRMQCRSELGERLEVGMGGDKRKLSGQSRQENGRERGSTSELI